MTSFKFYQIVTLTLLIGLFCSKRASAVTICFDGCSEPAQQIFTVLYNPTTGDFFLKDVHGLLEMQPFSISLSAKNEILQPENARSIPFAGEPNVVTADRIVIVDDLDGNIVDDLDGDGEKNTYTSITWDFPALDRPAFEQPVYAGRIISPGEGLARVSFQSQSAGFVFIFARPEITLIPEPSTAALLLTSLMLAVARLRR